MWAYVARPAPNAYAAVLRSPPPNGVDVDVFYWILESPCGQLFRSPRSLGG
jgi:hypothetical protein